MTARQATMGVLAAMVVAATAAGVVWWRSEQRREVLAGSIPATPDLASWPGDLSARVEACLGRIVAGTDSIAALGELSRLYHANGFYAEARQCYEGLGRLDPAEPRWLHRHADILAGYGDVAAAVPLWRRVEKLAPRYLPARLRLGDALFKGNHFDEAAAVYLAILEVSSEEPHALLGLARCDFEAGRWEEALRRLERVVELTDFELGYDLIVTTCERLGQQERADRIRGRARTFDTYRDPADPWIAELLDDCYDLYRLSLAAGKMTVAGDRTGAARRLKQALALAEDNVNLHFQLATVLLGLRELSEGRRHLERCVQLDPTFSDGWVNLASLLLKVGDGPAADHALAEGLKHCPESPSLHLQWGRRLKQARRVAEAMAEFKEAARLRPNEAAAHVELGLLCLDLGRTDEGIAGFKRALQAEPDHPVVLVTLAMHAISEGDEAEARSWIKMARNQPRVPAADLAELAGRFRQKFGKPVD